MSEIIPVFSRKPIFGYPVMVAATVGIGFVSMSVWAHHMFTIGMSSVRQQLLCDHHDGGRSPDGDQDLQLAGHDVGRQDPAKTPMLFCIAFLFQFLIAGLTGIMHGCGPV